MKTMFSRLTGIALPALFAALVIFAATAEADGGKSLDPIAMGQSIRAQLAGVDYQYAIAQEGELALTGEAGFASPVDAVQELQLGTLGGSETMCHLSDNGVEVVVILTDPPSALPQPCGIVGEAMDAAA